MIAGIALAAAIACAPPLIAHNVLMNWLGNRFKESVVAAGIAADGRSIVEVTASDGGTWTVVATDTAGCSQIVASGKAWTVIPQIQGPET